MRVNFDDSTLRCIRCNAELENQEDVECYHFNGMVAMCRQCLDRTDKYSDNITTSIERFLNGNVI